VDAACAPLLGEIYRCIVENPDAITCRAGVPKLACDTCSLELDAAGEPCGQTNTCEPEDTAE
jgi:hypothetical protein